MGERNSEVRILNKIEVEKAVETHADTIWRLAWIHCNRVQENAEDVLAEAKEVNRMRREETTEEQAEEKCE